MAQDTQEEQELFAMNAITIDPMMQQQEGIEFDDTVATATTTATATATDGGFSDMTTNEIIAAAQAELAAALPSDVEDTVALNASEDVTSAEQALADAQNALN